MLVERSGAGRFGEVWRARDELAKCDVALKLWHDASDAQRMAFERRFPRLQALSSASLVRLRESYLACDPAFFIMDWVAGSDLLRSLRGETTTERTATSPPRSLPLAFGQPVQEVGVSSFSPCPPTHFALLRRVVADVARALLVLHGAGFVHRDVQPSNIRVNGSRAVLLDLDLAVATDEAPDDCAMGTAAYLAPEQAESGGTSPSSDCYALGLCLFEVLTGASPFFGSAQEILLRKRTVGAPPPSLLVPGVPDDLDALCRGLLSASPKLRPNAAAVLAHLGHDA